MEASSLDFDLDELLKAYAQLVIEVGVQIQPGQTLVLTSPIGAASLAGYITTAAYQAGAKQVYVEWDDDDIRRIKFFHAPDESFTEYPMWKAEGWAELARQGAAFAYIEGSDPEALVGVDPVRIGVASKTASQALQTFRELQEDCRWNLVAYATPAWARKVFPGLSTDEAVGRLWQALRTAVRLDAEHPVTAWRQHVETLGNRASYLNNRRYRFLHYKAEGTDLTIELPENHLWVGGSAKDPHGISYVPNMPTDEVFTMPKRDGVHGTVRSTRPLAVRGNVIEHFTLRFEQGKIVDVSASRGQEVLQGVLDTDEGARYLGEVALVPYDSPISRSQLVYFNTLFDENASCHLAIGNAYPFTLKGGPEMTKVERASLGANDSLVHVDFMMGSADLEIDGETWLGQREAVFRHGNWAL